jgi:sugar O-acyltransferase (sialic acid O-acetyltransferase NeuD family)
MKRLIILGTGGNCLDILDALLAINVQAGRVVYECAGFLDDNQELHGCEFHGVRVVGPLADSGRFPDCVFVNGIGSPANFWRKPEIINTTGLAPERFETIIHPQASVSSFARLGHGCVALAGTAIGAGAEIGNHVFLLPGTVVSHDCRLEDCVSVASGACLSGGIEVGKASYIGANSSIRNGVRIGARSLVGIGSVVLNDVPDHTIVVGNPARVLRPVVP